MSAVCPRCLASPEIFSWSLYAALRPFFSASRGFIVSTFICQHSNRISPFYVNLRRFVYRLGASPQAPLLSATACNYGTKKKGRQPPLSVLWHIIFYIPFFGGYLVPVIVFVLDPAAYQVV